MKDSLMIESSLIQSHEPTFFRGSIKSCIDHIYSNIPTKITNIRTHFNPNDGYISTKNNIYNNDTPVLSDHCLLSWANLIVKT